MTNKKEVPVIFKKIHAMIIKRVDLEGKIDRHELFSLVAERVGHLDSREKNVLVYELKAWGIIASEDSFSFLINRSL